MIYGDFIMKLLTNADAEHLNRNALFMWLEGEDKKCCRKFRAKWFPIKKIRSAEIYVGSATPPFETFCPNAFLFSSRWVHLRFFFVGPALRFAFVRSQINFVTDMTEF